MGGVAVGVALRLALSAALLAVIVSRIHLTQIAKTVRALDPGLALLGIAIGVVTVVISSLQWQVLVRARQIQASLWSLTGLYFLGMTFGQVLPSSVGGDLAKAVYLGRRSGRMADAAGATLMARVIGLIGLLATSLPVAVLAPLLLPGFSWLPAVIFLSAGLVLVLAWLSVTQAAVYVPARWVERVRGSRVRPLLSFVDSLVSLGREPRTLVTATAISAVFYLSSNLNFYAYGLALHIAAPFWFYWIAVPLTALATMLPVSINGYGIRAASFVLLFSLFHVPAAAAVGLALAMEVQMLIFAGVGGLVVLAYRAPRPVAFPEPIPATISIRQEA